MGLFNDELKCILKITLSFGGRAHQASKQTTFGRPGCSQLQLRAHANGGFVGGYACPACHPPTSMNTGKQQVGLCGFRVRLLYWLKGSEKEATNILGALWGQTPAPGRWLSYSCLHLTCPNW